MKQELAQWGKWVKGTASYSLGFYAIQRTGEPLLLFKIKAMTNGRMSDLHWQVGFN